MDTTTVVYVIDLAPGLLPRLVLSIIVFILFLALFGLGYSRGDNQ